MSDITVINDSQQSELVTNGLAKNGELYLKASGSTDAGSIVVYDSGSWRRFTNDANPFSNTYSVEFDGTNDYLLMGTSAISLDTNFTISAWFKPTANALSGYDFIGGWGNKATGQSRVMQILNSRLSFEIYLSRINGATTLSADTWYHGAVTFSGNDVEIFLNGSSDGTGTLSRATMTSSLTFAGGTPAMTAVGFKPFSGLIDEFAVFDSVLSSSNITAMYNSGVPTDISSLSPVGWWRMGDNDSGTGTTITDQGSGGNNGTLTNGPTFSTTVPS